MPQHTLAAAAFVILTSLAGTLVPGSSAAEPDEATPATAPPTEPAAADILEQMKEAAAPGDQHKRLARMEGEWNCELKFWLTPDSEPEVSRGRSVHRMILDGRILETRFIGDLTFSGASTPFAGLGVLGYDKPRARYFSFWTDTLNTSATMLTGSDAGPVITFEGTSAGIAGQHPIRQTYRWIDDNAYQLEFWEPDDSGEFVRTGLITYTRAG